MKATADDDSPIPGYLYNDICHILFIHLNYKCQMNYDYKWQFVTVL